PPDEVRGRFFVCPVRYRAPARSYDAMSDATHVDQDAPRDEAVTDDQHTDQQQQADTDSLGDKGEKALKAERDARRKAERELKARNARTAELENAGKSEEEQREAALKSLQTEAERWKTRALESAAKVAVSDAAAKANAIEPAAIFALVSRDIDYDDDGQPTNVADVIAN